MDKEIAQLMEMGATAAQARAALRKYKDVMQAAERFFDGEFADVMDEDGDSSVADAGPPQQEGRREMPSKPRMMTPQADEDSDGDEIDGIDNDDDDDDEDGFVDYDSDYEMKAEAGRAPATSVDPYAGIFFSKDRREEVIEVEEEPEICNIPGYRDAIPLLSQGQWMKGCPEGGEQGFLFSLYSELSESSCPCPNSCGYTVSRTKRDFFAIYPEFNAYVEHLKEFVRHKCKNCPNMLFCLACGEPVTAERTQAGVMALDENPLYHCSNLQGVILGTGLTMLENLFQEQSRNNGTAKPNNDTTNTKKRKAETTTALPQSAKFDDEEDESYYSIGKSGKKAKGGVGYAGQLREDMSGQVEAASIQKAKDEEMANLLKGIRKFLPNLHREGGVKTSDYLVHPTTLAHLRRRFNFVSSTLLRNDSLADMSDRSVLYFELFHWLQTISNHEALASMMGMPIMVVSSVKAVNTKKSGASQIRERNIVYEGSSGPRELLEAIVIQAQAACKGLEGMKPQEIESKEMTEEQKRETFEDKSGKGKGKELPTGHPLSNDENQRLLDFCHRILNTAAAIDRSLKDTKGLQFLMRLKASLPKVPSSMAEAAAASLDGFERGPSISGASEEETTKLYVEWATKVRFEYCDLTLALPEDKQADPDFIPNYKHYFNNEARMLANAENPRRALAIAKELAVLTTNLPVAWNSTVFLRVDESRVDIIKALIIGPEGTPYYNGCYLFDIFLGSAYNQSPPSVKYMTTNGAKFRFNPNLYADGKVCLSLLGTWQGPGWVSGKSTLLQVLVSIQSMILCDEPYLNEPGWQNDGGSANSRAYSANVRRMVVNTAMLGNLKNPPEPFEDVIRTHYRLKAKSLSKQLDNWLAQDDGGVTCGDGAGVRSKPRGAGGSSNGFRNDIDELKALMAKL